MLLYPADLIWWVSTGRRSGNNPTSTQLERKLLTFQIANLPTIHKSTLPPCTTIPRVEAVKSRITSYLRLLHNILHCVMSHATPSVNSDLERAWSRACNDCQEEDCSWKESIPQVILNNRERYCIIQCTFSELWTRLESIWPLLNFCCLFQK